MDRDGVEQLVISLNDWRVDKAAVKTALIEAGERAVEPLLALLWRVQGGRLDLWDYAIADIVAKVGDVRFLAPLVELLNAEPALSRGAAATALGGIGGTRAYEALAACVLREKDEGVRSKIFDALAAGKDAAIKPLADILAAGHIAEDVRRSAADALVRIGGPNVVEPLSGCLPHHQPRFDIRRCCSEVFAKTRDRRATLPLIAYLSRKPHHELQSYAVGALGEIGDARAVDALIECLKDENARVRKDAAEALGKIQDGRGTMPLVTCLNDESIEVHPEAAKALGRIGDARAVDFLVQYLGNRGPHAHWWAESWRGD